jgi:UDP-N-acetylglucosamine:LPS N-acetylglucosamine transferase
VADCTTASVAVKRCANKFREAIYWHGNAAQNHREKSSQSLARGREKIFPTQFVHRVDKMFASQITISRSGGSMKIFEKHGG